VDPNVNFVSDWVQSSPKSDFLSEVLIRLIFLSLVLNCMIFLFCNQSVDCVPAVV